MCSLDGLTIGECDVDPIGNWGDVNAGAIVTNEMACAPRVGYGGCCWRTGEGVAVVVGVIRF